MTASKFKIIKEQFEIFSAGHAELNSDTGVHGMPVNLNICYYMVRVVEAKKRRL